MAWLRWLFAAAILMTGSTAVAEETTPPGLVGLLTVTGKCLKVTIVRDDVTARCTGQLGIAVYADGRTGFHFMMQSRHIITVSGMHAQGNTSTVKVDRVILNDGLETNKPQLIVANGSCSYGDPYQGKMTVRCSGTIGRSQDFLAAFETDGSPPVE